MAQPENEERFWSSRPPEDDMPIKYLIVRCPAKGVRGGLILSHDVVGRPIHYWNGRSRPCLEGKCEPCDDGNVARWRGYIFVAGRSTGTVSIFELTAAPMRTIDTFFREHRTLRGATIDACRKGDVENGELRLQLSAGHVDRETLAKVPSLRKLMARIWKIDKLDFGNGRAQPKLMSDQADGDRPPVDNVA